MEANTNFNNPAYQQNSADYSASSNTNNNDLTNANELTELVQNMLS